MAVFFGALSLRNIVAEISPKLPEEFPYHGNLLIIHEHRCMADAGNLHGACVRAALAHCRDRLPREQIGSFTTNHQRRAADRVIQRPQIDILTSGAMGRHRSLERYSDARIVTQRESPARSTLDDIRGEMPPLRIGEIAKGRRNNANVSFRLL
jgi:hypothetical protein